MTIRQTTSIGILFHVVAFVISIVLAFFTGAETSEFLATQDLNGLANFVLSFILGGVSFGIYMGILQVIGIATTAVISLANYLLRR